MITAIIRNKENTLVLELPHSIYDIYEKLQSIGIMQPPKQIPLTDNEGEDIGVKLFSESDFGQHLLLTLNEKNTIADANMLTLVIGAASEDIKEELEQNRPCLPDHEYTARPSRRKDRPYRNARQYAGLFFYRHERRSAAHRNGSVHYCPTGQRHQQAQGRTLRRVY